jgi:hypothetical protein
MPDDEWPVSVTETELDYAYVRDIQAPRMRSLFIRLQRPGAAVFVGDTTTQRAFVDLDLDSDGRLMGVSINIVDTAAD